MKINVNEFKKMQIEQVCEYDYKINDITETFSSRDFYGVSEYVVSKVVALNGEYEEIKLWVVSKACAYEIVKGAKEYDVMLDALLNSNHDAVAFEDHEILAVYDNEREALAHYDSLECKNLKERIKEVSLR